MIHAKVRGLLATTGIAEALPFGPLLADSGQSGDASDKSGSALSRFGETVVLGITVFQRLNRRIVLPGTNMAAPMHMNTVNARIPRPTMNSRVPLASSVVLVARP